MTSLSIDILDLEPRPRPWFETVDKEHEEFFTEMGYGLICKMHGRTVGISQFIYTTGIVVGMDDSGYEYRYCYHTMAEAAVALMNWVIKGGEEPEGYIKRKG